MQDKIYNTISAIADSINISDFATLLTAIAGLVTAIVALWNVRELRLMREVSSSPVLIAENSKFIALCDGEEDAWLPVGYTTAISITNFGNGPALHAKAEWEIRDEQLIEILRSYDPHDNYKIGFEKSQFTDDPCLRLYWHHFTTRQLCENLNPIVPFKTNEKSRIEIPPYYLQAFHLYIRLAVHARSDRKTFFEIRPFPSASVEITYKDLSNTKMRKKYQVTLAYNHNGTHALDTPNAYACSLNISSEIKSES